MSVDSSSASKRATLVFHLADLLGFEDGAEDVLQYLESIETTQVRVLC